MKTKQWSKSLLWLLFVWLMVAPSASAFYNPSTGRWLSRDPIGETRGDHLFTFIRNCPSNGRDNVGLSFDWTTPTPQSRPEPLPNPENPDADWGGQTYWLVFSPNAVVWSPRACPCYQYQISVFGSARVFYWWLAGHDDIREHELVHVNEHFYPAFLAFKESAESYQGSCMSKKRADCIKAVIEGPMREVYMMQANTTGAEYDCKDYGHEDPTSEPCRRYHMSFTLYSWALAVLQAALDNCNSGP